MITLEDIIRPSQRELFCQLYGHYHDKAIACEGKFLLIRGTAPMLLVAHLDTVHHKRVKTICKSDDGNIIMSPEGIGGDDRCGVYALVKVYALAEKKPWLLFTCDEETGAEGAKAFIKAYQENKFPKMIDEIKCILELDRKGENDAVYYNCINDEFETYISSKGFKTDIGSFSDISLIAPEMGVAAVNLSVGYYNAHSQHEYIDCAQLETVIGKVGEIVEDVSKDGFPRYEFVGQDYAYSIPDSVPQKYAEIYSMLLDYYYPEEIEEYRDVYGNMILLKLYEYAFGKLPECKGKGSGINEHSWPNRKIPQTAFADGRYNKSG